MWKSPLVSIISKQRSGILSKNAPSSTMVYFHVLSEYNNLVKNILAVIFLTRLQFISQVHDKIRMRSPGWLGYLGKVTLRLSNEFDYSRSMFLLKYSIQLWCMQLITLLLSECLYTYHHYHDRPFLDLLLHISHTYLCLKYSVLRILQPVCSCSS